MSVITRNDLLRVRNLITVGVTRDEVLKELDLLIRDAPNYSDGTVAVAVRLNAPTFESARHPKSQRFHEILHELGELHDRKQRDYGNNNDPFANVTASLDWAIRPVVGALLRMNDKVKRLQQWVKTGTLANEGVHDSMRDIAVYVIIALVLDEWDNAVEPINEVVPSNI